MSDFKVKIDDRTVHGYARDLSKVIILDAKTERQLFLKYKKTGDLDARNRIIESGLRFVIKVAQGFSRDLEHHKVLISAGNEGLLAAIDRFDPNKGTRFLSYATWWVTLYIREELHRSAVVTIPMWRKKSIRKVRKARDKVRDRHGRDATDKEVAKLTGFTKQQLAGLTQETFEMVPLDVALPVAASPDDTDAKVRNEVSDQLVQYLISQLPIRDAFVCRAYFGFLTDPPMSLKQVASILGISSERVRQIKMDALTTLKRYLEHVNVTTAEDLYDD